MSIAGKAIDRKVVTLVLTVVMLVGGAITYQDLSRLEDPEFTIKEALVITSYPGASAQEVEEEVTDLLEKEIQQLAQVKYSRGGLESRSVRGLSTITVRIKDKYKKKDLPQVWDELRRKVGDAQGKLPPGAGPSVVNDDYADVWGIFVAIHGAEYTYDELRAYAKLLRKELLLVKDVAKVGFYGERKEVVYVELSRDKLSQLGISEAQIVEHLREKNVAAESGRVHVGREFIALSPTGEILDVKQLEKILISQGSDKQIRLGDVATVRRGYVDPPTNILRYDQQKAIGLGVSCASGGNVVKMGHAIEKRMKELLPKTPLGIEIGVIAMQSQAVESAISGFLINLLEAVGIVVVVLMLFMGLRSAAIIGFVLVLTIAGTFIFMGPWEVALERISLGALVIALGMLVDNAIVVVDGMLVRIEAGEDAKQAADAVVGQNSTPLLGATVVAILAFGAIGLSPDSTGEFCQSLFQVILISLFLSWITGVTVTPLLCVMFLRAKKSQPGAAPVDPYGGKLYQGYRRFLGAALKYRPITLAVVIGAFVASIFGFGYVDNSFFPDSTRPQFMVDYWVPQGTHIYDTEKDVEKLEQWVRKQEGVTHVASMVGQGAMRILVTYSAEKTNTAYAQLIIDVDDVERLEVLRPKVEKYIADNFPQATTNYTRAFILGPGAGGKIQARFMGPDPDVLRKLANQATEIMRQENAKAIRTDWRQRVKVVRPLLAEEQANVNGISREDVAMALLRGFDGQKVGVYRERDELIPIVMRPPQEERNNIAAINNLQIWSPAAQKRIPLRQVVTGFETVFEDEIIMRRNRKRTMVAHCDAQGEMPSTLLARVMPRLEKEIKLPRNYELMWGGEYEDSGEAQGGIKRSLPFFVLAMVLIVIGLFNTLRQPAIIWATVPLALIGVTLGLLVTKQPFGFMSMLGALSLSGMLIKNAIVLIDQIKIELDGGKPPLQAIMDSGVSRLRPVAMAALTTALGMLPLFMDRFFVSMAVTIVFGLMIATVLTMVVVPVLYAVFYRVKYEPVAD